MNRVRQRRQGEPDEEKLKEEHAALKSCLQPEDGPCKMVTSRDEDHRCRLSKTMLVSCPYLGSAVPLKEAIEEEKTKKKNLELVYEPPPKVSV